MKKKRAAREAEAAADGGANWEDPLGPLLRSRGIGMTMVRPRSEGHHFCQEALYTLDRPAELSASDLMSFGDSVYVDDPVLQAAIDRREPDETRREVRNVDVAYLATYRYDGPPTETRGTPPPTTHFDTPTSALPPAVKRILDAHAAEASGGYRTPATLDAGDTLGPFAFTYPRGSFELSVAVATAILLLVPLSISNRRPLDWVVFGLVFLMFPGGFIALGLARRREAKQCERERRGIWLLHDTLLARIATERCVLVPKASVKRIVARTVVVRTRSSRTKDTTGITIIAPEGSVELPPLASLADFTSAVAAWSTGRVVVETIEA